MYLDQLAAAPLFGTLLAAGPLAGGWLWTIVIGIVIGALAKLIVGGREPVGCIITMLIGIAGSVIALLIGRAIGHYEPGETPGFLASLVGAIVLLFVYHMIIGVNGRGGPKV